MRGMVRRVSIRKSYVSESQVVWEPLVGLVRLKPWILADLQSRLSNITLIPSFQNHVIPPVSSLHMRERVAHK